jgi:hypothetical protein
MFRPSWANIRGLKYTFMNRDDFDAMMPPDDGPLGPKHVVIIRWCYTWYTWCIDGIYIYPTLRIMSYSPLKVSRQSGRKCILRRLGLISKQSKKPAQSSSSKKIFNRLRGDMPLQMSTAARTSNSFLVQSFQRFIFISSHSTRTPNTKPMKLYAKVKFIQL